MERVPEILLHLEGPGSPPFLDRPAVELLFGVRRRQAIHLMHRMEGYQVGKTFLAGREAVIRFLRQPRVTEAAGHALARKRRVVEHLDAARRELAGRTVRLTAAPGPSRLDSLPPGVELQPGRLTIRFERPLDLLEKLFALSQAMSRDFERFQA